MYILSPLQAFLSVWLLLLPVQKINRIPRDYSFRLVFFFCPPSNRMIWKSYEKCALAWQTIIAQTEPSLKPWSQQKISPCLKPRHEMHLEVLCLHMAPVVYLIKETYCDFSQAPARVKHAVGIRDKWKAKFLSVFPSQIKPLNFLGFSWHF